MARPLRIEYEGAIYHIISRGNRGEHIFTEDQDCTSPGLTDVRPKCNMWRQLLQEKVIYMIGFISLIIAGIAVCVVFSQLWPSRRALNLPAIIATSIAVPFWHLIGYFVDGPEILMWILVTFPVSVMVSIVTAIATSFASGFISKEIKKKE